MTKRRSFFKSLMGAVAAVALAPEIAFGVRLRLPEAKPIDVIEWTLKMVWKNLEYLHATLSLPCSDEDKKRFLQHGFDVSTCSVPAPESVILTMDNEPQPYWKLQELRHNAGLTSH